MRLVQHADDESASESSSDEDLESGSDSGDESASDAAADAALPARADEAPAPPRASAPAAATGRAPAKIKLTLSAARAQAAANGGCKVCGSASHSAGFQGSVYVDCPDRPCYLCKQPGHTTATCPFRLVPETGVAAAAPGARGGRGGASAALRLACREAGLAAPPAAQYAPPKDWRVTSAVIKLHSRRVTALEFHPQRDTLILSSDKRGQLAFWDYQDVFERTVLDSPVVHLWLISAIRFMGTDGEYAYTSSMDGSVARVNCETHSVTRVAELNAGIAPPTGVDGDDEVGRDWRSVYAMDVDASRRCCLLGDDRGEVHVADERCPGGLVGSFLAAKKGTKVVSVGVNPADPAVFVTAGNDHVARLWDIRRCGLRGGAGAAGGADPVVVPAGNKALALALASLPHPRVVNAAAFSPLSGRKLLTTCQDNRVRVWDDVARLSGSHASPTPPDRELVHSHDFSRYLTAFKAVWDPKDASESAFVIGRYISEDVGGRALHPVDYLSAANGRLLAAMKDANVTTICPVAVPHPRREAVATGSSRNIYVWEPDDGSDEAEAERAGAGAERARAAIPRMLDLDVGAEKKKRGARDDDDDDGPFGGGKKKSAKAA